MSNSNAVESQAQASPWIPTGTKAITLALWYAAIGVLWIGCSTWGLSKVVSNPIQLALLEALKDWLFVVVTACLIGLMANRYFREIRRSARELEDNVAKWRSYIDHAPVAVLVADSQGRLLEANRAAEEILGYEPGGLLQKRLLDLPTKEMVESARPHLTGSQNTETTSPQCELQRKDGSRVWTSIRSAALPGGRTMVVLQDVTERRAAIEALRHSEQNYREIFNATNEAIFLHDPATGRLLDVNEATVRLFGFESKADALGSDPATTMSQEPPFTVEEALRRIHAAIEQGPQMFEWLARRKNGQKFWAEVSLQNSCIDGQARVLAVVRDISERKRAEQALRESEAALRQGESEFRAMFEIASIGMGQADPATGRFLRVNDRMCAITGYSAEEMLQLTVTDITHPEDRQRDAALFQEVVRGDAPDYRLEKRYLRKDGTVAWVNVNMTVFRDSAGQPVRTIATIEDITERRLLEAQLRQAQKLEAVGRLAGGVAHDFNNILAAILMHLGILREDSNLTLYTREALKELEAEAKRATTLTRQLLMFSRRSILDMRVLDLNGLVENLLKMLRRLIGEHIDLRFEPGQVLAAVEADPGMLEQVLMNLAVNARDAMPRGGRLTIRTRSITIEESDARTNPEMRPGKFVCLSVTDTGCGMDVATLKRIFEPFFTTKEAGKGTGLGLATVHGIIGQHKGWVEVQSELGQGTEFRVLLPASGKALAAPVKDNAALLAALRGSETVLLVEDEAAVRRNLGQFLRVLGYRLLQAANGREALAIWEKEKAGIALLLTDMVMPGGITGLELAERFKAEKPELKIIISSGYSNEFAHLGRPAHLQAAYLPKPYDALTLGSLIRSCLTGEQPKS